MVPSPPASAARKTPIDTSITAMCCASAVTTFWGVLSMSPPRGDHVFRDFTWFLLAAAMSIGLASGIARFAKLLYERFSSAVLIGLLALAGIAAIFDFAFFHSAFAPQHYDKTRSSVDLEAQEAEYNRLTREGAALRGDLITIVTKERLVSLEAEGSARMSAQYESDWIDLPGERGKGPRFEGHMREAASAAARAAEFGVLVKRLRAASPAPRGPSWEELEIFHRQLAALKGSIPFDVESPLPSAPQRPPRRTSRGNVLGGGGLAHILELILDGRLGDPLFYTPAFPSLAIEFGVPILVLGAREWGRFLPWARDLFLRLAAFLLQTIPLRSLAAFFASWLFFKEDDTRRGERRDRIMRVQRWRETVRESGEMHEIHESLAVHDLQKRFRGGNGDGSASPDTSGARTHGARP